MTWFYVPYLLAWEFSVVTTQLGHWLALATLIFSLPLLLPNLKPRPDRHAVDLGFKLLAFLTIASFLAPLAKTLMDHPGNISAKKLFTLSESPTPYQRFTFMAANDKTPLNLDFYPPSKPAKNSPWILVIHGGGWINGSSDQLPELNWSLTKKGYAVISIDYRLSPGWLWPAPKDDAFRALDFIRAHAVDWNIDPSRWAILGRSAGAQIAGVVAYSLRGGQRPKGFISFYGPSDLVFGYDIGQENDILRSRTLLRGFLGGTPIQSLQLYKTASEMEAVTTNACPTLLIHGDGDVIVSPLHSKRLMAKLQKQGVDTRLVTLHFGPHGFDFFFNGPEGQVSTFESERFLKRVLPIEN